MTINSPEIVNANAAAAEAYQALVAALASFGPYEVEEKKTSLHFVAGGGSFLGVHPRKDGLRLTIVLARRLGERVVKAEQVSKNRFHNELDIRFGAGHRRRRRRVAQGGVRVAGAERQALSDDWSSNHPLRGIPDRLQGAQLAKVIEILRSSSSLLHRDQIVQRGDPNRQVADGPKFRPRPQAIEGIHPRLDAKDIDMPSASRQFDHRPDEAPRVPHEVLGRSELRRKGPKRGKGADQGLRISRIGRHGEVEIESHIA
ncbi:MAG: hypothetical protein HYR64_05925 [Fimbriimonas ginsengisoli]|uniref:DUF5655 domain-containing protein n=1 Tax=Fimbriimonas ginsengisoli TaxID=1005039 RepID=A0A931PTP2_FIMGI|nr:hypothetical protein [Fimbriimonas ginsengisoli]